MNIYKLKFATHEESESTFIALGVKEVINNEGVDISVYTNGTQAVVKLPPQVQVEGVYDENGEVIVDPVFYPEVFYDVMTSDEVDFGVNEIFPLHPIHRFGSN